MARHNVYMADHKGHVCNLSLAQGCVVMDGHKVYTNEPKVHMFDLILGSLILGCHGWA
jgi:hypothetical protein